MQVIGIVRDIQKGSRPYADQLYPSEKLSEIAPITDYFVVVLPNTPKTYNLIDENIIRSLNPNAVFINIGRGNTIHE